MEEVVNWLKMTTKILKVEFYHNYSQNPGARRGQWMDTNYYHMKSFQIFYLVNRTLKHASRSSVWFSLWSSLWSKNSIFPNCLTHILILYWTNLWIIVNPPTLMYFAQNMLKSIWRPSNLRWLLQKQHCYMRYSVSWLSGSFSGNERP